MASPPPAGHLTVTAAAIRTLALEPLQGWRQLDAEALLAQGPRLELSFDWPRADEDPRELSEIAELRLWSLRADACCPWLPLVLERSSGQLGRHVAMLLPHSFSRSEGLRFAPEALELWITHRLFVLDGWAQSHGLNCRQNLGQMAAMLGYELDAGFWELLG
ncbi:MAG: CRR6 family NdhI maturation factor [Cyanobacteriota bacterium]|nr:CRR6 family NdhI maturation factor [Cyanobacteriota bacterium]